MIQTKVKEITLHEFLQLPETKPASEYIGGQVIQKPMPQGQHSLLQRELLLVITAILGNAGIAQAFPELRCTFGGRSIVPDVAIFQSNRVPRLPNGRVANTFDIYPDWTIEILSPGQSATKVLKNIRHCLDYGSQMGWLINPEDESIFIGEASSQFAILDGDNSQLPMPEFAVGLSLTIGDIFGWLKH
jgi:Uma2 family endonuclease